MKKRKLNKLIRQMEIYRIFYVCRTIEYREITRLIDVSIKTIQRDVKDLSDAGLIAVRFSKKRNGYVHLKDCKSTIFDENGGQILTPQVFDENQARNRHLKKLNRLAVIIVGIENEDIPLYEKQDYDNDTVYQYAIDESEEYLRDFNEFPESDGNENRHYYNYVDWYKETFPDCSKSTMYRDFKDLKRLGLQIGYNREEQYYDYDFDSFFRYY